jgi:hypothetical protein
MMPGSGGSVPSGAGYGGQTSPGSFNSGSMGTAVYGNGQRMMNTGYSPQSGGADMSPGGYSQGGGYSGPQQYGGMYAQPGFGGQGGGPTQFQGGYGPQGPGGYGPQGPAQGYGPQGPGGGYGPQGPGGDGPPGPGMGGYGPPGGPQFGGDGRPRPWNKQDDPSETGRFWFKAEYLYWWLKQQDAPALATSGSVTDPFPAALGQPGTAVLFGDSALGDEGRSGGRIAGGFWLDCEHCLGFDGSLFFLGSQNTNFGASYDGANGLVLGRPFFDVVGLPGIGGFSGPIPAAEILAFPGVSTGSVNVSTSSRLHGADTNLLVNWLEDSKYRVDFLFGFNFTRLQESLDIAESNQISLLQTTNPFAGGITNRLDAFDATNNFYGAQFGSRFEYRYKALVMQFTTKTALGVTDENLNIAGNTTLRPLGQPAIVIPSGLYALQTNMGNYSKNQFACLSNMDVTLGWQVKRWCRIYGGYSFMYWSNVIRPADQIDQGVNRFFVPPFVPGAGILGPIRPAATFKDTDFWAHGITGGLEFRY